MLSSSYYGGVVVNKDKIHVLDFLMIALGCAFYGYGLVNVNIANNLAEGGVTGVTLIIRYWLHIDPAYTTVLINVPLILIGYRYLGKNLCCIPFTERSACPFSSGCGNAFPCQSISTSSMTCFLREF